MYTHGKQKKLSHSKEGKIISSMLYRIDFNKIDEGSYNI